MSSPSFRISRGGLGMCELLGLSSNRETTINLSLSILAQRGENPNMHGDGWGIAFHEGNDVRLIKDAGSAKNSVWVEFIKQREIRAHDIIAHIRKSTVGNVNYSNTHPFTRELLGTMHSFAHNGTLRNFKENPLFAPRDFHPIGETDSEHFFCVLMDRMKILWESYRTVPPLEERTRLIKDLADEVRGLGPVNFLYSDGHAFFAHGDERHNPITHQLEWPGLHFLEIRCDAKRRIFSESPESGLKVQADDEIVTLFASVPLDDQKWVPMAKGEVIAVSRGHIMDRVR